MNISVDSPVVAAMWLQAIVSRMRQHVIMRDIGGPSCTSNRRSQRHGEMAVDRRRGIGSIVLASAVWRHKRC
jgi:hypothetical protein